MPTNIGSRFYSVIFF